MFLYYPSLSCRKSTLRFGNTNRHAIHTHQEGGGVISNKICYLLLSNIIQIPEGIYRVSLKICYTYEFRQGSQSGLFLIRSGLLVPPCKRLGLYLSVSGCSTEGLVYHRAFPIELCDVYCALDGDLVSLTRKLPIHKTHAHAFTRYRVTM